MLIHFTFIIGGYRRPFRKINLLFGEKTVITWVIFIYKIKRFGDNNDELFDTIDVVD